MFGVVGAKKNDMGLHGVIESVMGDGRGRKFLVKWTTGTLTHKSARCLALAAGGAPPPAQPKKIAGQATEDTSCEASFEDSESGEGSSEENEGHEEGDIRFSCRD